MMHSLLYFLLKKKKKNTGKGKTIEILSYCIVIGLREREILWSKVK